MRDRDFPKPLNGAANSIMSRQNAPSRDYAPAHGLLFLFLGVILPVLAVVFESTTHFCATHFFDPFPTTNQIILFLLIPLSNFLSYLSIRKNMSAHYCFMSLASGMAMGVGVMYTLMFLPIAWKSALFVGAFGFGLLGLAPALSLPCSWLSGKNVCHKAVAEKTYFNPHQLEHIGHLVILVMVLAIELPSTLTRVHLGMASEPATLKKGISWLRKYGSQEVMLRACYERSGRATDIVGSLYESHHPLPVDAARRIFFKVYGKSFNSVPIPASARATIQHANLRSDPGGLNAGIEDEFDLDTDIAGESVSGVARGLSVEASGLNAKLDPDAMIADLKWSFTFKNVSKYDREARAVISLPPGSCVTRAVLTIDNADHDATIMVRETARAIYQQAVYEHKKDPLLVSTAGPDQILLQCYPIQPNTPTKVTLYIVSPLAFDEQDDSLLNLPSISERNFQLDKPIKLSLESDHSLSAPGTQLQAKGTEDADGIQSICSLTGDLSPTQLDSIVAVHSPRDKACTRVFCDDKFSSKKRAVYRNIRQENIQSPVGLSIVIDASASMKGCLKELAAALKSLPSSILCDLCVVSDELRHFEGLKPGSPEFDSAMNQLSTMTPEGGQDDSSMVLLALKKARSSSGNAVLWIHAAQAFAEPESNITFIASYLSGNFPSPILYDLQVSGGPVAVLNSCKSSSGLKRIVRSGSLSDDIAVLTKSWKNFHSADAARPEFVVTGSEGAIYQPAKESGSPGYQPASNSSRNEDKAQKTSSSVAQIYAYKQILKDLDNPYACPENEANNLAKQYHLVSPISSAVVVDEISTRPMLAMPVRKHDPLAEFFNPSTLENEFRQLSFVFDSCLDNGLSFLGNLNPMRVAQRLEQAVSQSFATTTNQLNRLNAVEGNQKRTVDIEFHSNEQSSSLQYDNYGSAAAGYVKINQASPDRWSDSRRYHSRRSSRNSLRSAGRQDATKPRGYALGGAAADSRTRSGLYGIAGGAESGASVGGYANAGDDVYTGSATRSKMEPARGSSSSSAAQQIPQPVDPVAPSSLPTVRYGAPVPPDDPRERDQLLQSYAKESKLKAAMPMEPKSAMTSGPDVMCYPHSEPRPSAPGILEEKQREAIAAGDELLQEQAKDAEESGISSEALRPNPHVDSADGASPAAAQQNSGEVRWVILVDVFVLVAFLVFRFRRLGGLRHRYRN